ncbi:MAG: recombinase RecA [Dictyoglomaceae bacterium]|nr:recombinase RecA [Dictyoglomaceae bacterium]
MKEIDKEKSLESAISQIEKEFGKGSIMRLGSTERFQVEVIPTGILTLDYALGVGGVPRGRIIELYGPEGSGKTTVGLQIIASAQKRGGVAAFIDAEHALDPNYAKKLGVNLENLLISQPDTGEQALEIAEILVRSGAVDVIVIDSVAALVPRAELEGEMGDAFIGLQARLMSQALRKLTGVISKSKTVAIFINQLREKVGTFFGNPETTPGGRALKFYASVRIEVRKAESMKEGSEITGTRVKVKVVKNKVAPPFKEGEFDLIYGEGISREGCILDAGVDTKVIEKSGTWYVYKDIRLQGRENAKNYLKDHPEIADAIEREIRKIWGIEEVSPVEEKTNEKSQNIEEKPSKKTTSSKS